MESHVEASTRNRKNFLIEECHGTTQACDFLPPITQAGFYAGFLFLATRSRKALCFTFFFNAALRSNEFLIIKSNQAKVGQALAEDVADKIKHFLGIFQSSGI